MSIACIIPARKNSTRFPGKLLAQANGKTVLQHTFEKALQCPFLDFTFVATDNEEIADHISKIGGSVIWTSESCQNGTERVCEALNKEEKLKNAQIIINLQGDHPCTRPDTISAIIQSLQHDPKASMATAVTALTDFDQFFSPHIVKCVFDLNKNALYFSRSPVPYHSPNSPLNAFGHIGIYAYRPSFLKEIFNKKSTPNQKSEDLEQLKVLENGHRIKIAIVEERILGIDTPNDLEIFKGILCQSNISL